MRTLSLALFLLAAAAPALAEERPAAPTAEEVRGRVDHKLDRIDATPEQRTRIHALVEAARERREAFAARATGLKAQIRDLVWAEDIDREALEGAREQAVALFDEATAFGLDHLVEVASVLTPEQRVRVHDQLVK